MCDRVQKTIFFSYWLKYFNKMLLLCNQDKLYKNLYFLNICAKTLKTN